MDSSAAWSTVFCKFSAYCSEVLFWRWCSLTRSIHCPNGSKMLMISLLILLMLISWGRGRVQWRIRRQTFSSSVFACPKCRNREKVCRFTISRHIRNLGCNNTISTVILCSTTKILKFPEILNSSKIHYTFSQWKAKKIKKFDKGQLDQKSGFGHDNDGRWSSFLLRA